MDDCELYLLNFCINTLYYYYFTTRKTGGAHGNAAAASPEREKEAIDTGAVGVVGKLDFAAAAVCLCVRPPPTAFIGTHTHERARTVP